MGEVIFDYEAWEERRRRAEAERAVIEKEGARIKAQVREAVTAARIELAEERGAGEERQRWQRVRLAWLAATGLAMAAAFVIGWAFARMAP